MKENDNYVSCWGNFLSWSVCLSKLQKDANETV